MPSIEINAGSKAMDYCFTCDKATLHNGAFLRWEDNSLEDVCYCTVCQSVHRSLLDDGVPHVKHQAHVHETAMKYLKACTTEDEKLMKEVTEEFRHPDQGGDFSRKSFLFYLESMEEAPVLYGNNPDQWPMDDHYVRQLQQQCERVRTVVTMARGGRRRPSTPPTLPGGLKR
jgi:hypothetical protein